MKGNFYDPIAFFYDPLSKVLGKSYQNSKYIFLDRIGRGDKVLYLGGGTGANLSSILEHIGEEGKIFYMEASRSMIEKARNRLTSDQASQIIFLHRADFSEIPFEKFDLVLTQFFLDILPDDEIVKLFEELEQRMSQDARWIFVDFFSVAERKWLIKLMIAFFRIFTGNLRKDLPDYSRHFAHYGWTIDERISLDMGFIEAWVMRRLR